MTRRAVFLDRDGTLNVERGFVCAPAELQLLPGVVEALRQIRGAGFAPVVVTNQSGIARGLYDEQRLAEVHRVLHVKLEGLPVAYFHCPHHPEAEGPYGRECGCRKPATGLIEAAAELLDLSLSGSFVVGDSARDIERAERLGLVTVLVRSGKPWRDQLERLTAMGRAPEFVADDLGAAVGWILSVAGKGEDKL